jgi:hypothetical protein
VTKVWFDDDNIWLGLEDGRQVSAPLAFYPRLLNATKEQRENYEFMPCWLRSQLGEEAKFLIDENLSGFGSEVLQKLS